MTKKAPQYLILLALCAFARPLAAQEPEGAKQPNPNPRGQVLRQAIQQQQQAHPLQRWLRQQMIMLQQLDLKPEQRQRLRAIPAQHEGEWQTLSRRANQARNRFERILAADEDIKPEVIEESARALGAAEAEFARLVGQIWNEVKQVLTPEQRKGLRETRMRQFRQRQLLNPNRQIQPEPVSPAAPDNKARLQQQRRANKLVPAAPTTVKP
jgi:Spy/CpxP family protein refolding chaperone